MSRYANKKTEVNDKVLKFIKAIVEDDAAFVALVDAADLAYENNTADAWGRFNAACAKAGVPSDTRRYLWALLTTGSIVGAKNSVQVDAPFCWA